TSRPYGESPSLLWRYAWFAATSHNRAWPGSRLEPNDLGLFDMLGNIFEWTQDPPLAHRPDRNGTIIDNIHTLLRIDETNPFLLRGGAFLDPLTLIRSAYLYADLPSDRNYGSGFRL